MELTIEQLEDLFPLHAEVPDGVRLSSAWIIMRKARQNVGIDLRDALYAAKSDIQEMSIFIEKILQPTDLDDVIYVIDMLLSENTDGVIWAPHCLPMLHAWRAKVLMMNVIAKRNTLSSADAAHQKEQP